MASPSVRTDQSMDEILASIKQIINADTDAEAVRVGVPERNDIPKAAKKTAGMREEKDMVMTEIRADNNQNREASTTEDVRVSPGSGGDDAPGYHEETPGALTTSLSGGNAACEVALGKYGPGAVQKYITDTGTEDVTASVAEQHPPEKKPTATTMLQALHQKIHQAGAKMPEHQDASKATTEATTQNMNGVALKKNLAPTGSPPQIAAYDQKAEPTPSAPSPAPGIRGMPAAIQTEEKTPPMMNRIPEDTNSNGIDQAGNDTSKSQSATPPRDASVGITEAAQKRITDMMQQAVKTRDQLQTSRPQQTLKAEIKLDNDARMSDIVRQLLRPMLENWLNQNLPDMVQTVVEEEVRRALRRR